MSTHRVCKIGGVSLYVDNSLKEGECYLMSGGIKYKLPRIRIEPNNLPFDYRVIASLDLENDQINEK